MLADLAVAVANGAESISYIAVLADQAELFGSVASDSACWWLIDTPPLAVSGAERIMCQAT